MWGALARTWMLAAAACAITGMAQAQPAYPSKPITLIVPFAAGGTSDVIARLAADEMGRGLDQRFVLENVGGAGGSIGLTRAARAAPDGYTLAIGNTGTNAAVYWTTENVQFTPDAFTPIGLIAKTSPVIALRKDFPAKSVADFIDYAKKNPGKISLGHAGVGSSNYLICISFIKAASIDVSLISYRGAAPALNDAMGGHVDGVCDAATSVASAINGNEVKGLVVSSHARLKNLPDVPAAAEAGVPAFQAEGWNALFAPKGTPEAQRSAAQGSGQRDDAATACRSLIAARIGRRADAGLCAPTGAQRGREISRPARQIRERFSPVATPHSAWCAAFPDSRWSS
jgi:tripartite-type tricarboxylate transporter receptor subunit TctC